MKAQYKLSWYLLILHTIAYSKINEYYTIGDDSMNYDTIVC